MNAKLLQQSDDPKIASNMSNNIKYFQTSQYRMHVPPIRQYHGYYVDFQVAINQYKVLLLTHSLTHFKFYSLININRQVKLLNKLCFLEQFSEGSLDSNQIRFLHFMKNTDQNQFIAAQESGQIYIWTQNKKQNWIATQIENEQEINLFYLVSDENLIILGNGDHFNNNLIERNSQNRWNSVYDTRFLQQPMKINIGIYFEFIFKACYEEDYLCKEIQFITENLFIIASKEELEIFNSYESQKLSNLSVNEFTQGKILLDFNKQRKIYVLKTSNKIYFLKVDFDGYVKIQEYKILQNQDDKKFAITNEGDVAVTLTSGDCISVQLKFLRLRY